MHNAISSEQIKLHRGMKSIGNNSACDDGIQTVSSVPCDSSMQLWLSLLPTKQVLTVHKYFNKSLEVEMELYFLHCCQSLAFYFRNKIALFSLFQESNGDTR